MSRGGRLASGLLAAALLAFPAIAEETPDADQLVNDAGSAYSRGDHASCGALYAASIEKGAEGSSVPYNAACCFSLAGDADRAFEFLQLAAERGWRNLTHVEADPDLAALRDDPRWAASIEQFKANRASYVESVDPELLRLYEEDQADRVGEIDWSVVGPRDEQRRRRVREILKSRKELSADDDYHAAMVLQHGSEPDDYREAHELARRAADKDPEHRHAKWLAAASQDRYLWSLGQPQIFGTQFRQEDGVWTVDPIDETVLTDEDRENWNVPPLAEARRRAEERNRANN